MCAGAVFSEESGKLSFCSPPSSPSSLLPPPPADARAPFLLPSPSFVSLPLRALLLRLPSLSPSSVPAPLCAVPAVLYASAPASASLGVPEAHAGAGVLCLPSAAAVVGVFVPAVVGDICCCLDVAAVAAIHFPSLAYIFSGGETHRVSLALRFLECANRP